MISTSYLQKMTVWGYGEGKRESPKGLGPFIPAVFAKAFWAAFYLPAKISFCVQQHLPGGQGYK